MDVVYQSREYSPVNGDYRVTRYDKDSPFMYVEQWKHGEWHHLFTVEEDQKGSFIIQLLDDYLELQLRIENSET